MLNSEYNTTAKDHIGKSVLIMNTDIDALIDKITDILVDVGQHDKRFKLGEWIKYSPSEVRKILQDHKDELKSEL